MKIKSLFLLVFFSVNINISLFASSLKFEEEIKNICGIIFQNKVGIIFEGEEPNRFSDVILYSNHPRNDFVNLKVTNLLKASNLNKIPNSDIFLVFDKTNKIKLSELSGSNVSFKRGKHQLHLEINRPRTHIYSGLASLEFEIQAICK